MGVLLPTPFSTPFYAPFRPFLGFFTRFEKSSGLLVLKKQSLRKNRAFLPLLLGVKNRAILPVLLRVNYFLIFIVFFYLLTVSMWTQKKYELT